MLRRSESGFEVEQLVFVPALNENGTFSDRLSNEVSSLAFFGLSKLG
jgi:hypothetical protein